jgi:hypothetical protein
LNAVVVLRGSKAGKQSGNSRNGLCQLNWVGLDWAGLDRFMLGEMHLQARKATGRQAGRGKQGNQKSICRIWICDAWGSWSRNCPMQAWKERLRNHRSVNANIERRVKAFET